MSEKVKIIVALAIIRRVEAKVDLGILSVDEAVRIIKGLK